MSQNSLSEAFVDSQSPAFKPCTMTLELSVSWMTRQLLSLPPALDSSVLG